MLNICENVPNREDPDLDMPLEIVGGDEEQEVRGDDGIEEQGDL